VTQDQDRRWQQRGRFARPRSRRRGPSSPGLTRGLSRNCRAIQPSPRSQHPVRSRPNARVCVFQSVENNFGPFQSLSAFVSPFIRSNSVQHAHAGSISLEVSDIDSRCYGLTGQGPQRSLCHASPQLLTCLLDCDHLRQCGLPCAWGLASRTAEPVRNLDAVTLAHASRQDAQDRH
jgi:hypothetical protein